MERARGLPLAVADYFTFEEKSDVKHGYVGGDVHAMSGASLGHNTIAGNIFTQLRTALRGGSCQVFMADVKVRLEIAREVPLFRRDRNWAAAIHTAADARVEFASLQQAMTLAEIYDGVF